MQPRTPTLQSAIRDGAGLGFNGFESGAEIIAVINGKDELGIGQSARKEEPWLAHAGVTTENAQTHLDRHDFQPRVPFRKRHQSSCTPICSPQRRSVHSHLIVRPDPTNVPEVKAIGSGCRRTEYLIPRIGRLIPDHLVRQETAGLR